jgi:BirA family biotin operon repressor/biotin-[acetyl-CoA-carboxylase] ligase
MTQNEMPESETVKRELLCRKSVIRLKTVDSTHKFALRLIENQKATECSIIAENQTAGIGRCNRTWESPRGNLFMSIIKKFPQNRDAGKLSLTVAGAVHSAISHYIPDNLYLHWPNDIHYKKSKLAGILIAVIDCQVVISVGINVNSAPKAGMAICLKDVCNKYVVSVEEMFDVVSIELSRWLYTLENCGFSYIRDYWLQHISGINCKVTVKNGGDSLSGIIRGTDDSGRLILEKDGQNLLISSGDMFLDAERITVSYE